GRREVRDTASEIAVEERGPEVEVLLPPRHVEAERVRVVAGQRLLRRRLRLHPTEQLLDRVARHQPRDRPVDRHRDDERDEVDDELAGEVTDHECSRSMVSSHGTAEKSNTPPGEEREGCCGYTGYTSGA